MSEDPTRPMPSGWPPQPGRTRSPGPPPGGYGTPDAYGSPAYGSPRDEYRSPGGTSRRPAGGSAGGGARRRRGHRGLIITGIVAVVVLILLVVADRAAAAYAENRAAGQIKSAGFPVKPKVTIAGFPFLTQVAAHDLKDVNISASNVPEGPLTIASVNATAHGVHLNSGFTGGTVDQVNGTALITFAGLSSAAGVGDGVTLTNGGNNQVKATVNLVVASGTALFQVVRTGPHQVNVRLISAGGLPGSVLGSLQDFSVPIPKLPAGMTVQSVSVTSQGVLVSIAATHTSFTQ